ncbi:MAG TPA: PASTA domain-containing protein [Gaiellaceae bacterium]|nr:PASTA domain-containing protein [Gaiellaceae bacterium]
MRANRGLRTTVLGVLVCAALLLPAIAHGAGYVTSTTMGNALLAGTTDLGNHGDDTVTAVALPFPIQVYGVSYSSVNVGANGNVQFGTAPTTSFSHTCPLPNANFTMPTLFAFQDDLYLVNSGYGILSATSGAAPDRQFVLNWHAQYWPGANSADFEAVFREDSGTISVIYGATTDSGLGEVSGIQQSGTGPATQFSCTTATLVSGLRVNYKPLHPFTRTASPATNLTPFAARLSGEVNPDGSATTYAFQWGTTTAYGQTTPSVSAGSGTVNVPAQADLAGLAPNTTYHFRLTATNASGTSFGADQTFTTLDNHGYAITRSTGVALVPGMTLVPGSQGDDVIAPVTFPFTVDFFGSPYTTAYLDSNGTIEFTGTPMSFNIPSCLPNLAQAGTLFAYHTDLDADAGLDVNYGIYTTTTGTAPNRQFVLEWQTGYFAFPEKKADFEVVFYENNLARISVVYGPTATPDPNLGVTAGVQKAALGPFTQYSCKTDARPLPAGLRLDYTFGLQQAPAATTQAATGVGGSTGTANGTVNPNGYETTARFQYGLTTAYGATTATHTLDPDTAAVALNAALSGLAAGTTYHYRITATNQNGTTNGADQTFTTTAPPPPPPAKCVVPKVVGLVLGKAKTKIVKANCAVGKVSKKTSPAGKKGKVLAQSPKPGKKLKNHAKVNLTVGKGP